MNSSSTIGRSYKYYRTTTTATTITTTLNRNEYLIDYCIDGEKINFKFECFMFKLTSDLEFALLFLLFFFIILLDLFLNTIVLISICKTKKLKRVDLCFLSNAIADLLMGLIVMPCTTLLILFKHFPLNQYICFIWNCLDFTAGTVSMLHIMFISYDRYLSVSKPLQYTQKSTSSESFFSITRMPTSAVLVLIWFVSMCAWLPVVFYLKTQEQSNIDFERSNLTNFTDNLNSTHLRFIIESGGTGTSLPIPTIETNKTANKFQSNDCSTFSQPSPYIIVPHSILVYFIPMILIFIFYTRTILIVRSKIRRRRRQSILSSVTKAGTDDSDRSFIGSLRKRFSLTKRQGGGGGDIDSTTILQKFFSRLNFKLNASEFSNTTSSLARRSVLEINNLSISKPDNTSVSFYVTNDELVSPPPPPTEAPRSSPTTDTYYGEVEESSLFTPTLLTPPPPPSNIVTSTATATRLARRNKNENNGSYLSLNETNQKLRMQFFLNFDTTPTKITTHSNTVELNSLNNETTNANTTTTTTVTTTTVLTTVVPRKNLISFNEQVSKFDHSVFKMKSQKASDGNNLLPIIKRRKSYLGPSDLNVNLSSISSNSTSNETSEQQQQQQQQEQKRTTLRGSNGELKRNFSLFNNFQPNYLNTFLNSTTTTTSNTSECNGSSPLLKNNKQHISPSSTSVALNSGYITSSVVPNAAVSMQPSNGISAHTKREKYVTYKLGIIMVAFIVCWFPFCLFWAIDSFCKTCIAPQLYLFSFWLAYLNSIFTPLILLYTNTKYRQIFFARRCFNTSRCCACCASKYSEEYYYTNGGQTQQQQPYGGGKSAAVYRNRANSTYYLMNRDKSCNFGAASAVYGGASGVY